MKVRNFKVGSDLSEQPNAAERNVSKQPAEISGEVDFTCSNLSLLKQQVMYAWPGWLRIFISMSFVTENINNVEDKLRPKAERGERSSQTLFQQATKASILAVKLFTTFSN